MVKKLPWQGHLEDDALAKRLGSLQDPGRFRAFARLKKNGFLRCYGLGFGV